MRALFLLLIFSAGACESLKPAPELRISGVVTARFRAEGPIEARAEGCAQFAADGRTCERVLDPGSLMRVASITKFVLAIGIMRLVEEGKLDLDRDITHYLGYSVRNPNFPNSPITLRNLMAHTSSLLDGNNYVLPLGASLRAELADASHYGTHQPGTYFTYSNFGFVVIGTVMEAATRERLDFLMKRLVLDPLGIEGCYNWATCAPELIARAATIYRTGKEDNEWQPDGPWIAQVDDLKGKRPACPVYRANPATEPCDLSKTVPGTNGGLFSPQGGLRTNAAGLATVARLFLNEGRHNGKQFLEPESIELLLAPQWRYEPAAPNGDISNGLYCAYGLGVQLMGLVKDSACRDDVFGDGRLRIGHQGDAYGYLGGLWVDLETGRGAVYLITGTSDDPHRAPSRTAFTRIEERVAGGLR